MSQIIECVPNFSEGRNQAIVDALADVVRQTPGCSVLDVDPGKTTNRTVLTFVGNAEAVVNGAFNLVKAAKEKIDMSKHSGAHARMGAVDVCPFIPVANATVEDCVKCAKAFGARVGAELDLPIYLYEEAQPLEYRKSLAQIRDGEYEAVHERIVQDKWKPDFGPAKFVPSYGATVTGCRFFLIAYNVNILGTKEHAMRAAFHLRSKGRGEGHPPGLLKQLKGIGWFIDEYNMAQLSVNIDDYRVTPMHVVFEECKKEMSSINVACAGTEVVGLVPLVCMIDAAKFYMEKENLFITDERQMVALAVDRLGLKAVCDFDPNKRIIEWIVQDRAKTEPLASLSLREFTEALGARSAAPGGGSASAAAAAMGGGLGAMMGWMTYGSRKWQHLDEQMRKLIPGPLDAMKNLIPMIDADTNAFNGYMVAMRMPKGSPEEISARDAAMENAMKEAIEVPLSVMREASKAWESMLELAKVGNMSSRSDLEVGAKLLETGIWGAHRNVLINMPDIKDEAYRATTLAEAKALMDAAEGHVKTIVATLEARGKA